jgi:hypothetical protein
MYLFTSGRDYRPHAFFANRIPPEATYVRVLVYARDARHATDVLDDAGLFRYAEAMREPTSVDKLAEALRVYLALTVDLDKYPVFLIYQARRDFDGTEFRAPRFYAMRVVDNRLVPIGRVRVVAMGDPLHPNPVARVVTNDDQDDPVPMPPENEGPGAGVIEGVLPYPPGQLGRVIAHTDRALGAELDGVADRLALVVRDIAHARTAEDPRVAWMRASPALLALSGELAALAARASTVEVALRHGAD